jgi:hypothetical protein
MAGGALSVLVALTGLREAAIKLCRRRSGSWDASRRAACFASPGVVLGVVGYGSN